MYEGGYFNYHLPERIIQVKNGLVAKGAEYFLRTLFANEVVLPGSLYMGLTNSVYTFDTATLAGISSGEPVGNGYARQLINRDTTDWTISEINGAYRAMSKIVDFTATANWDKLWVRMFLCDAASGTVGNLFSLSGAAITPQNVIINKAPSLSYEFWLRG